MDRSAYKNVNERLRASFGPSYQMTLARNATGGLTIHITFKIKEGELLMSYNVLLVVDEYMILGRAKKIIDWQNLGFNVVATAENAMQGLSIFRNTTN